MLRLFPLLLLWTLVGATKYRIRPVSSPGYYAVVKHRVPIHVIRGAAQPTTLRVTWTGSAQSHPFCSYELFAENRRAYLRRQLDFDVPTQYQRSYNALIFVIHKLGDEVARGADYDEAYENASELLSIGDSRPQYARDYFLDILDDCEDQIEPVKTWVHENLLTYEDFDREDLLSCDQYVSSLIRANPYSQRSAKLVIELGKLSRISYAMRAELTHAAYCEEEEEYVENGREDLKPYVMQYAVVARLLGY